MFLFNMCIHFRWAFLRRRNFNNVVFSKMMDFINITLSESMAKDITSRKGTTDFIDSNAKKGP